MLEIKGCEDKIFINNPIDHRYDVQMSEDDGKTWISINNGEIKGLTQGKTYQFRIVPYEYTDQLTK